MFVFHLRRKLKFNLLGDAIPLFFFVGKPNQTPVLFLKAVKQTLAIGEPAIKMKGVYQHWNHPVPSIWPVSEYSQGEANTRLGGRGIKSEQKEEERYKKKSDCRTQKGSSVKLHLHTWITQLRLEISVCGVESLSDVRQYGAAGMSLRSEPTI